ncbi:hypothetical protein [Helicobacter heilmannii]|uniref:hypothetical protein n=1 Tax=Helicobacter heilmannii TaxID=35817 RepID=UPI0006A1D6E9|nr:hypothetical protein [Helicobacter heilmannii]CRF46409.1 probable periplasmic protein Cj1621 [Helicobacter heilmannii]CRF48843.1 probable periplasmic protein Cj1621 [Helicobacter heilmannii]CRF51147.1 probable periplasmic protein Cj1621 [Helicobacter heilmannii]BDQ27467.1 hypothetical protein ASB1_11430 [Helicobacter heilmannii]GMB94374.1 hypothetical protein NHP21011_04660 [Helicobacter heilmannii]
MRYIKGTLIVVFFLAVFIGGLSFERFILGQHHKREESSISMQIKSTQVLTPKTYSAHFVFGASQELLKSQTLSPEQDKAIKEGFQEINALAQKSHLCQQATYSVHPYYAFGSKQEISGYSLQGVMDCKIPANKRSDYDTLKEEIFKTTNKSGLILPSTPALYPQIEEIDWGALRQDLIKKAQEQASWMGKQFKKECHIQHLDFYPSPVPTRFKTQGTPAKEDFMLSARLSIGC